MVTEIVTKALDYTASSTKIFPKLSAPIFLEFEPVGRWYEVHCLRRSHKKTLSSHTVDSSSSDEEVDTCEDETDEALLHGLDPKEWKKQDHYAVLGLKSLRSDATEDQIKKAYKRKVLRHHPDKRRARGIAVKQGEDDYFSCITMAYETIGNPTKRRSYDSVDPEFDNSVPHKDHVTRENFYTIFDPVFSRNSKWSNKKPVPQLGHDTSSYDHVCDFYAFWYDFDSWREYSYLDEEEKEKGENRDERRWIEKQNRATRQKRKKEETARIRQLVDLAYACDPRVQRFKREEKEKKLAEKRAKQEMTKAKQEEEERLKQQLLESERLKKEKEEEESRIQAAEAKKKKEEVKKLMKKERKAFRTHAKNFQYFTTDENQRLNNIVEVEKIADWLSQTAIQSINASLSSADTSMACELYGNQLAEYNSEKEREKREMLESLQKRSSSSSSSTSAGGGRAWSEEELHCLIKAVNVFPAGTQERWEVIAKFISQHIAGSTRSAKEVLAKAKELQKNDMSLKATASNKAFEHFEKVHGKAVEVASAPTERVETIAEQQIRETGSNPAPWSAGEQKLLEQALKTFGASEPERWEKITAVVGTRSKKDCMKRYKELVELVKAKKAAQDATRTKHS